jgi:hypothetical protein
MDEPVFRLRTGAAAWQQTGELTVVLDLEGSSYAGLNAAASLLWSMLADGATKSQLVHRLSESYELTEDRAAEDVQAFIEECGRRGYLD